MKSSILLVGVVPFFLGGCAATEQDILGFAADTAPKRSTQRQVETRQKTKSTKQPQPQTPALLLSASEPSLPAWSVPSSKPLKVLRSTLTPTELFTKVSPAVYAVAAEGQPPRQLTSQRLLCPQRKRSRTVTLSPMPSLSSSPTGSGHLVRS